MDGLHQIYSNRNRDTGTLSFICSWQNFWPKHLKAVKWWAVKLICVGIKISAIKQSQFENFKTHSYIIGSIALMKVVQTESSLASVQYGDLYPWEPLLTFAFNFTICKLQSSSNVLKAICKIIITINQQKIITSKFQTAILSIANNVFCKMQIAIKCILQIANRNPM